MDAQHIKSCYHLGVAKMVLKTAYGLGFQLSGFLVSGFGVLSSSRFLPKTTENPPNPEEPHQRNPYRSAKETPKPETWLFLNLFCQKHTSKDFWTESLQTPNPKPKTLNLLIPSSPKTPKPFTAEAGSWVASATGSPGPQRRAVRVWGVRGLGVLGV